MINPEQRGNHPGIMIICLFLVVFSLQCDGEEYTSQIRTLRLEAICFLNIPSYGAGTNPWGTPSSRDVITCVCMGVGVERERGREGERGRGRGREREGERERKRGRRDKLLS